VRLSLSRTVPRRTRCSRRVWLVSPCGWGNLGDAAILQAAIENIRARIPGVEIIGITLNPEDTERRHGIAAVPIGAVSNRVKLVRAPSSSPLHALDRVVEQLRSVSWRLYRLARYGTNVLIEVVQSLANFCRLRHSDTVVICGGGQLDEFFGGSWGHPYAMWKWAALARLRRARFLVMSTGHGPLRSQLGRFFVRRMLRMAQYVSYRTEESQQFVRELGEKLDDHVVPDLAFSLAKPTLNPPARRDRLTVGVSPIAWRHPRYWPEEDERCYRSYLDTMTCFVRWLIQNGYRVRLFATDGPEHEVVADIAANLGNEECAGHAERLSISSAATVDEHFARLNDVDLVVASRLHGVILAYVAAVPVVTISYEPKVDWLVNDFDQSDYLLDIQTFTPEQLISRFQDLEAHYEEARSQIMAVTQTYQNPLRIQYDLLFRSSTRIYG
jgi:polysaccharide pyruvyl transferase WcaK-like protein